MVSLRTTSVLALFFLLVAATPASAKPDYLKTYEAGLMAIERNDWERAAELMQKTLMHRADEANRLARYFFWKPFLPQYYYGVARFHLDDCPQALRAFQLSEEQGVLLNKEDLHSEMLGYREQCLEQGVEAASAGPGDSQEKRVRAGDYAESGTRILDAAAPLAVTPEAQKRLEQTRAGLNVVKTTDEEAQRLGELGDGRAPEALDRAIEAFFSGQPAQALTLLEALDDKEAKVKAHIHLLRAAAAFRLYLLSAGTQQSLRHKAIDAVKGYKAAGHPIAVTPSLFSPRFLEFLAAH